MSFSEEYAKLRKKRLEEEEEKVDSKTSFAEEYAALRRQRLREEEKSSSSLSSDEIAKSILKNPSSLWDTLREDISAKKEKENALLEDQQQLFENTKAQLLSDMETYRNASDKQKEALKPYLKQKYGDILQLNGEVEEDAYFTSGLFADGYDYGDVSKTILGTGKDASNNFFAGALEIPENLMDAALIGVGHVSELFGNKSYADVLYKASGKDIYDAKSMLEAPSIRDQLLKEVGAEPENYTDYSILGGKTNSLLQSGGQMAGAAALQAVGVPWQLTMGASSYSQEFNNAKASGATTAEAAFSAAVSAGAEILTERFFKIPGISVSGQGKLGSSIVDKLAKSFSGTAAKNLLNWGVNMIGEGAEETVTDFFQRLGQVLSYEREETWEELANSEEARNKYLSQVKDKLFGEEALESYKDSFIGGAAMSAVGGLPTTISATKNGVDLNSGLSKNEQAVVDKLFEKEVADREKTETISQKDKAKIYEEIVEKLEKGQLNTDDIEAVLGGEDYKAYKETLDKETALEDKKKALQEEQMRLREERQKLAEEYTPLNNKAWNERSGEEYDRMDEIDQRIEEIKNRNTEIKTELKDIDSKLNDETAQGQKKSQKAQLSQKVYEMSKSDRLVESYLENVRKTKKFEADLSKYSEKQKAFVQKAMDSGVLNNSSTTHELVDLMANIHEQKGVDFDFTNNEKLKESGFSLDGAEINGFVNGKNVTVNVNAKKALNSVVGHEVAHVLEGSQMYDALAEVVETYAKTKGEFDTRLAQIKKLYTGKEGYTGTDADAKFRKEVVADLVGDYIFTDKAFVQNLSTNRNVFQKIYDEIKYLYNVATAGSEQKRQLEKAKKIFAQVWRDTKNTVVEDGVRYALGAQTAQGQFQYTKPFSDQLNDYQNGNIKPDDALVVGATPNVLKKIGLLALPMTINQKHVGDALNGTYKGTQQEKMDHTFTAQELGKLPEKLADPVAIIYDKRTGKANASESTIDVIVEMTVASGKQVLAAVQVNGSGHINGIRVDANKVSTVHGNTDTVTRLIDAINDHTSGNVSVFYLNNDKTTKVLQSTGNPIPSGLSDLDGFIHSITDTGSPVKMRISSVTESQQFKRWFGDWQNHPENASKIVNTDGTPKVMYHGSPAQFTVFDRKKAKSSGHYGKGFYFTDSTSHAGTYGNQYSVYLNIRNPLESGGNTVTRDQVRRYLESVAENEDYSIENYGTYDVDAILENVMGQEKTTDAFKIIQDINLTAIGDMVEAAELFNTVNGTKFDGIRVPTETVAFYPEQIKSATDNIGTFDGNNPDIRYSMSETDTEDIAPVGWQIRGEDVAMREQIAPLPDWAPRERTSGRKKTAAEAPIAPMPETVKGPLPETVEAPEAESTMYAPMATTSEAVEGSVSEEISGEEIAPLNAETVVAAAEEVPAAEMKPPVAKPARQPGKSEKERKWYGTSTASEAVDGAVTPDDIPDELRYYQPIPNKKTLGNANDMLELHGYDQSLSDFKSKMRDNKVSLDDIALGERLIQEAVKKGDTKTATDLIMDISILGTELGQKVQALSIIKRLTPEGQLKMLTKAVERGKTKGDKAYKGVEITEEDAKIITDVYKEDGTFDQKELTEAVETVKQRIADRMKIGAMDYVNEWRYLSMLGNPKTHIRNIVSNIAMSGTRAVKNAVARTIEGIAPIKERTKTWKQATDFVKDYAKQATMEEYSAAKDGKYSDDMSLKSKRKVLKGVVGKAADINSALLSWEDKVFSKSAYRSSLQEYLTANGIKTEADLQSNPQLVAKAKAYAMQQAKEATFQQDSYIASKISEIERKNPLFNIAIGSTLPFKKTPINIAKTAAAYSPLGTARVIYDAFNMKNGKVKATETVDHIAQSLTGWALFAMGYFFAQAGILNGAGEDDKESKYDYQLGEQAYSFNFNGDTYSLSWLSPVAMPLFVGANAYEQLVEEKDWDANVTFEAICQTLDPLSEMSFLSSLDSVLSSYDSGIQKFGGIFETAAQSYVGQFIPTLSSQVAAATDDTKRSTKASADSGFKFGDSLMNQIKYKIPGLRQTLEPTTDVWGNEVKQTEDDGIRTIESFFAPWSKRNGIGTTVDEEIKELYSQTGDTGLIPTIPNSYLNYGGEKYNMSAEDYTQYKKLYGQTAYGLLDTLFEMDTYQNASAEERADMVNKVYDYAREEAKREYFEKQGVDYTNATKDGEKYYKEEPIKGAIDMDMALDEYKFFVDSPGKYSVAVAVGGYEKYTGYKDSLNDIKSDKDKNGDSVSGSRKKKVVEYINSLDASFGEKIILFKSEYPADDRYNRQIVEYLNSREDLSAEDIRTILTELDFKVDEEGYVTWD